MHKCIGNLLNFHIVMMCRYLDSYEKHYFLGEEEEDESGLYYDEEDSRVRPVATLL